VLPDQLVETAEADLDMITQLEPGCRRSYAQVLTEGRQGASSQQLFRLLMTSVRVLRHQASRPPGLQGEKHSVLARRPLPEPRVQKRPVKSHRCQCWV
jgi:hypothetical protein